MERGAVTPVPSLRRNGPRAARRLRPHARRLPRGRKPTSLGEIVQLDTPAVSPHPGRPAIKQFTAHDPVAKWTRAQAWRRASAHNAKRFLDKLQALGGHTPAEYLTRHTAEEPLPSHMS